MFQTPLLHLTDQKQAWICKHVHMYPEVPKSSIQCLRTGTYGIITMSLLMEAVIKKLLTNVKTPLKKIGMNLKINLAADT